MALYDDFISAFREANADLTKRKQYEAAVSAWNCLKDGKKVNEEKVKNKIQEFKAFAVEKKHKNILALLLKSNPKKIPQGIVEQVQPPENASPVDVVDDEVVIELPEIASPVDVVNAEVVFELPENASQVDLIEVEADNESKNLQSSTQKRKAPSYKQDLLKIEIASLNAEITAYANKSLKHVLSEVDRESLSCKVKDRDLKEKELKKTEDNGKRQAKLRGKRPKIVVENVQGSCKKYKSFK